MSDFFEKLRLERMKEYKREKYFKEKPEESQRERYCRVIQRQIQDVLKQSNISAEDALRDGMEAVFKKVGQDTIGRMRLSRVQEEYTRCNHRLVTKESQGLDLEEIFNNAIAMILFDKVLDAA